MRTDAEGIRTSRGSSREKRQEWAGEAGETQREPWRGMRTVQGNRERPEGAGKIKATPAKGKHTQRLGLWPLVRAQGAKNSLRTFSQPHKHHGSPSARLGQGIGGPGHITGGDVEVFSDRSEASPEVGVWRPKPAAGRAEAEGQETQRTVSSQSWQPSRAPGMRACSVWLR